MEERQLINKPTRTSSMAPPHCSSFTLPSNGILVMNETATITLSADTLFKPECTATSDQILTGSGTTSYSDFRDPFYASTIPECYALAATTMIAYMLVIMLFITPRTFLHEGAVVLGRRGFTNGPSGSDAGIGIGGRPWLQKVAALTVAISLTIATADTLKVAEQQYLIGIMDGQALQAQVEDGTELKVIRVISDTFLWLAQAQTLIRLFPRQREKVIIKWTAFALISLDVLFSILNNFVYDGPSRPRSFVDAVPALAYLFQLALSLLYAAWVIYYSITKKAFAFYHPQMKNICLVALLSLVAVLVPVVFFVLDISKPNLAGWGDYVRWVGAAAASVVVWEWVERIEALERDDKKDGILGREVFDGDEMLELSLDSDSIRDLSHGKTDRKGKGSGGNGTSTGLNGRWPGIPGLANRYRSRPNEDHNLEIGGTDASRNTHGIAKKTLRARPPLWPTRPPPTATPVSRTDTASAESTVYAIRYHPISDATPPIQEQNWAEISRRNSLDITVAANVHEDASREHEHPAIIEQMEQDNSVEEVQRRSTTWRSLAKVNLFRKRSQNPPLEVSGHTTQPPKPVNMHGTSDKWDVRARLEDFAATQAEKLREKTRPSVNAESLPITVIPAPPRRRNIATALDDLEDAENTEGQNRSGSTTRVPSSTTKQPVSSQSEGTINPQPHRDPYRPDNVQEQDLHQRGAISFVTTPQYTRNGSRTASPISPISTAEGRFTPLGSRDSPIQPRSPTSSRRAGMPLVSIPAPSRRPRTPEE